MKAFNYNITIQSDPVHSYTRRNIREVYIPELGIYANHQCVFGGNSDRLDSMATDIKPMVIDDGLAKRLNEKVCRDRSILKEQEALMEGLKNNEN